MKAGLAQRTAAAGCLEGLGSDTLGHLDLTAPKGVVLDIYKVVDDVYVCGYVCMVLDGLGIYIYRVIGIFMGCNYYIYVACLRLFVSIDLCGISLDMGCERYFIGGWER